MAWQGTKDLIGVGMVLLGYAAPLALVLLVGVKRRKWWLEITFWRGRLWAIGFWLTAAASFTAPLFLVGVQFLSDDAKRNWFTNASYQLLAAAIVVAFLGLIFLAFGRGKLRWLGLLAAVFVIASLYVMLMAMSF